ncbi:Hypothetical predicted protein [Cloeon dipterum]|uniref:Uncharacterized protein n=1 Tax=Cloeon dipterum TaxID=197152 RepID=A0A8S1DWJ8_9INSE|nr:Hypothetical predicted protein [Cloeon dipterum]
MEENLAKKNYRDELMMATVYYIKKKGLKVNGTIHAKIKKCIDCVIMPWFFSSDLVKVSSKAGQGKKNVVKIADTNFVRLIVDSINRVAGECVANQELVETLVGDYLRRAGSKLRQGDKP